MQTMASMPSKSPGEARLTDSRAALEQAFAETGYLVFRDIVSKPALSHLHQQITEEFERTKRDGTLFAGGGSISGHLNCFPGEPARFAYDALVGAGIVDLIEELAPGTRDLLHVGCNYNMPNSATQHYHADSAFLEPFLIANIAVVDTDIANGAIDVSPGTNRKYYKYWRFAVERPRRARLPLNKGDVLVRTSTLWHRGMPNRTAAPRPMLAFTFGDRRAPKVEGDPFRANDGKILFYPNWYRPTLAGRLRERAFVAAPITYDGYRFVRSLFSDKGYATP